MTSKRSEQKLRPQLKESSYEVDPLASIGPGQSRAVPGAKTSFYRMTVVSPGGQRMTVEMPAESKTKAKLYAANRWPQSRVSTPTLVKR